MARNPSPTPLPPPPRADALRIAVEDKNMLRIKKLLEAGADPNQKNAQGNSVLHIALMYGYQEIALLLIENKADVNTRNFLGMTPLMMVINSYAYPNKEDITRMLIEKGADIDLKNNKGETALDIATARSLTSVIFILKEAAAEKKRLAEEFARAAREKKRDVSRENQTIINSRTPKRPSPKRRPPVPPPSAA